jgi:hypothetical protein
MDQKCNDKCTTGGNSFSCDPLKSDHCCIGQYCSANAFGACVACRATGTAAEVSQNVLNPLSCCSGHADSVTKQCTP